MSMYSGLGSDDLESIISLLNQYIEASPEVLSKILLTRYEINQEVAEKLDDLSCGITWVNDKFYVSALGVLNGLLASVDNGDHVIVATINEGIEEDTENTEEDTENTEEENEENHIIENMFLGKRSDFYIKEDND